LHLRNGSVHEFALNEPGNYSLSAFAERDLPVEARGIEAGPASEPPIPGRTMRTLLRERGAGARDASVEIQRRLSFPFACISFALLAVPLGARPRRGGRAAGFLITLLLISGYYLTFTVGAGLARQGLVPVWAGIWSANVLTAALGLFLLPRLERMPGSTRWSAAFASIAAWRIWKIFLREDLSADSGGTGAVPALPERPGLAGRGACQKVARPRAAALSQNGEAGETSRSFSTFTCCVVSSTIFSS